MECYHKYCGSILVAIGVLYLLKDLNVWDFWNISWWSLGFILAGVATWLHCCCPTSIKKPNGKKK